MAKEVSTGKVSWNAAEGIIMEISNRRVMANTFYIQGNINKAFNTLISIKQTVIQSFLPEERKKLKEMEDRFHKISGILNHSSANSFNPKIREANKLGRAIANTIYPEFNDYLMDLLQKRGYLVGEMSDASRMKF